MESIGTVLIADDHPLVRAGVAASLSGKEFCQVVGEAGEPSQTLSLVSLLRPTLLILDLELGGLFPAERLIRLCREQHPALKILVLSSHTEARYVLPLRDLQVDGFVFKCEAPDSLAQAVRVVLDGARWFSHQVASLLGGPRPRGGGLTIGRVTPREAQVLKLMGEGKDNQSIADQLGISKQTVRRYATILYEKLGVKNRIGAILALQGSQTPYFEGEVCTYSCGRTST